MKSYADWLSFARRELMAGDNYHNDSEQDARVDAEVLLAFVTGKDRAYLYTWPDKLLSAAEAEHLHGLLQRRVQGEPVAYILGSRDFWSLSLSVNPSVLIPRPETELLVETALEKNPKTEGKVIDLGTGSGAIVLSVAREKPMWRCYGSDISEEAIATARENAQQNNVRGVRFLLSNWFVDIEEEGFDLVLSNPPYIEIEDEHLTRGDLRYEPSHALVAADKGLAEITKIIQQSCQRLKSGAWLLLEHGAQQGPVVRALLAECGYQNIETRSDLAGHERLSCGQWLQ